MTDFLVLEDKRIGTERGASMLLAGRVISDAEFDIPSLRDQAVALILFDPATMGALVDAFISARGQRRTALTQDADLVALLLGEGVFPITAFTPGSVIFANASGALAEDNANLFWDDALNRLGIGAIPTELTALVELTSTTRGFLVPVLTTAQRDAITAPASGLQIYNATMNSLNYFNGTFWVGVSSSALSTLSSATSTTTAALGFADVYRMTTNDTTLTISTADITEGRVFVIRAISAGDGTPVTIATEGAQTIDGAASITLTTNFASVTLQAVGGNLESIQ